MHFAIINKNCAVLVVNFGSALCRSRRERSNACFLAKFGFDTAENELRSCGQPGRCLAAASVMVEQYLGFQK